MTTTYAEAFARLQKERRAAISHEDRDLSPQALTAHRLRLLQRANENLAAHIPTVPEITGPSRTEILDGLHPATADEIAVSRDMRERIQADLDRGRRLEQILASADQRTIVSLLHWLPTMPDVAGSQHRDEIVAEIQALAFERLAEIGHEPASTRRQAEEATALPAAVTRVFSEALAGTVTTGAWTDLHRADPDLYREIQAAEIPGLADEVRRFGILAERQVEPDQFAVR
ncbi:hypothetical protein [Microbacterium sp. CH1]|uniref:hypothetical protein n=1 Tax=Microbacterium sp. CH1 TaxID=1770208 RepID=UPI00078769CA|nr:hypothetical protein [Microbacterium sp. CH1]KYJ97043.1 hypothetical protein AUV07_04730 [Microbacterium sp. CH1]